ncbi:DUF3617 domain-containing protein [Tardiphaga sp.]|jgi:hypothetical protein|uniref:DUF3617 domain-containing protein n=1 Tax=Tardiphaga sp. TaxID=1926292 RepID=UPI0037DA6CDE
MIQRASLIALTLLCSTGPLLADPVQLPIRKAGLWEVTMQITGASKAATPAMVTQQCTDESVDRQMNKMSSDAMTCSKQEMAKTGSGYVFDSVCTVGDATVTSHAEAAGDFNSAYSVKTTAKSTGGGLPPEMVTVIQAKWLSACKADQKPGDMVMPGGMKMNINDLQKMKALQPK